MGIICEARFSLSFSSRFWQEVIKNMGGIRKKKVFFEIPFGTRYGELKLLTTAKRKSFALLKGHSESI